MSQEISEQTVLQVAKLAKIKIDQDLVPVFQDQLSKILEHVGHISDCPSLDQVEPFFGACELINATREDNIKPSSPRNTILQNAPQTDGEFYLVPPVFD